MADRIVHELELVDVEEHHSHAVGDAARVTLRRLLQTVLEQRPVREACEVVIERLAPKRTLHTLQLGDVRNHAERPEKLSPSASNNGLLQTLRHRDVPSGRRK